jgi:hypothetical protein
MQVKFCEECFENARDCEHGLENLTPRAKSKVKETAIFMKEADQEKYKSIGQFSEQLDFSDEEKQDGDAN